MPSGKGVGAMWYVYMLRCGDGSLYTGSTTDVARRLRELRQQELAEGDPQAAQTLRQRQQELRPLLREARELAEHTAHYYDRRYIRREKYRI